jgi:probable F420-dependent oxidoreductase
MADRTVMPVGLGIWSGFLDRLPAAAAIAAVKRIEMSGLSTIWLQEYSGVDPFVRAALYLEATDETTVALGVATIHARDPEAMVAAATTLHDAFPGRFVLGLGASHGQLTAARGGSYTKPLTTMRDYLAAMNTAAGRRRLPPRFLGALGPRMVALAGQATTGLHTYFCPVSHSERVRSVEGEQVWIASSQMVAGTPADPEGRDAARRYLRLCLGMPNYRRNLKRFGFDVDDIDTVSNRLVDALVVRDDPDALADRILAHRVAGADHIVLQFISLPGAEAVLTRIGNGTGWASADGDTTIRAGGRRVRSAIRMSTSPEVSTPIPKAVS